MADPTPPTQPKEIKRSCMSEMKLEVCDGENVCCWCFEVDETVLRHVDTDTYWHQHCKEASGAAFHQLIDWLP